MLTNQPVQLQSRVNSAPPGFLFGVLDVTNAWLKSLFKEFKLFSISNIKGYIRFFVLFRVLCKCNKYLKSYFRGVVSQKLEKAGLWLEGWLLV